MSDLQEFITLCSERDTPVGDLARDIFRDDAIPENPDEDRF
ncbi:MAG: hypothetical protein RIC06_04125 [Cyclobacteriaceae bacterium]